MIRSPSCFERPYGVSTGSGLWGSSSSPCASPVTTVEQNTIFGSPPAAFAASASRRVPSTFVAVILASLRCEAISAARWITHSGRASATASFSAAASSFAMSPCTAVVPGGSDPGRRVRATTSCPRSISSAQVMRPTKPVAPVTSTLMGATLPGWRRARQGGCCFLEPVVPPEQLAVPRDGRNAEHAARRGSVGGAAQLVLDGGFGERALGVLEPRLLGRGEGMFELAQVPALGERL